ncbi:MAG: hypothetical protein Q9184_008597 [Pyrenodesmia sp. 2 TL-2023]
MYVAPTPTNVKEIQEAFEWIVFEIEHEGGDPEGYVSTPYYRYDWISVLMFGLPVSMHPVVPVSRMDTIRVVNAIKGLFFTYNYGPRVLGAEIRIRREVKAKILLAFRMPDATPSISR